VSNHTDRDLQLLHRLQKGRLGLRGRSVNLVREQQVTEDRSRLERELALLGVVDVSSSDLCREQVRRELNTLEVASQGVSEGIRHQGLGKSRVIFEQQVAVREDVY